MGSITAKQVAKTIGVSQSTVSRAFTEDASIAAETRERVMRAALKLGYEPNVIARSLSTRRTNIVGIVMANLTNPFYPEVLEQLSKALQRNGLQTLLFNVPPGKEVDDELPLVLQYQVDAVIITSSTVSSRMATECAERGAPVILLNRYVPSARVHAISCDNLAGGRQIADYLLQSGHRRPAFVAGRRDTTTNLDRERGFVERLAEKNVAVIRTEDGNEYTYEAGAQAALRLISGPVLPDAIFFANDIMAIGGLDAIRGETTLRVPADLSVVGFDDIAMSAWPSYGLTTVRQPVTEMVEAAVAFLTSPALRGTQRPNTVFIPGQLIVRNSTSKRTRS